MNGRINVVILEWAQKKLKKMSLNLSNRQLRIGWYIHELLHMSLIVITANTQHIKGKEYKHINTKESHQITKGRANEERNRTALQKQPQNN